MSIVVEQPSSRAELLEFVRFHDEVYEDRSASWSANTPHELGFLTGEGAAARDRTAFPLLARVDGRVVARVVALVDHAYRRHWDESLGHLVFFEALPGSGEATQALLDEACARLAGEGLDAARMGFLGTLDVPFTIDAYDVLTPAMLRHNPAYYHALIKQAGFETEQGWVDYRIEVTPELERRYEQAVEVGRAAGFELVWLQDVPEDRRVRDYTATWNHAFTRHWGQVPITEAEVSELFEGFALVGGLETSVLAYRGDEPVGILLVVPDMSQFARLAPGRTLQDAEKLNILGIGVHESARGRGLNYAMAGHSYLELIRRGATHLSYTLVLDDNWPSRRTGEGLGGRVCANYVTYRRNFRG